MAQNAFVQSIKTITESLIRKAGFDKTRSGKVVGINPLTNTYSVQVDGYTYHNVRTVNDATYNLHDTVKVNIPVNQPSQMYISASIFSDASIGNKIAHAETLIDAADKEISDIIEIMGNIYQLSIRSEYTSTSVTHYGVMMQNGEDVTAPEYTQNFYWYLEKPTGKELQGTGASLTLSTSEFLYGQAILLEWVVDNVVKLRANVTLFDNSKVEEVNERVSQAIEIAMNEQQYYWFTDTGTDTGAHISFVPQDTFVSNPSGGNLLANSRGVAVRHGLQELVGMQVDPNNTNNASVYFNGYVNNTWQKIAEYTSSGIWFHDSIPYTIGNTDSYVKYEYDSSASKYKIYISADSITLGNTNITKWSDLDTPYLTEVTNGGLFVHRADTGHNATDPASAQAYGIKIASTVDVIQAGKVLATYGDTVTFNNTSGYTMMQLSNASLSFYRGTSSANYALATFGTGSITLKNTSGVNTFVAQQSGLSLYNGGTTTNVELASFTASGVTLKNDSGYTIFSAGANSLKMYSGTATNITLAEFGTGGMTLKNSSGYTTLSTSASAMTIYSGTSSNVQIASFGSTGMTLRNSSGYLTLATSASALTIYDGTSSARQIASFGTGGMTLKNANGYTTASIGASSAVFYTGTSTNYALCTIDATGMTLKDSSNNNVALFAGTEARVGRNSNTANIYLCQDLFMLSGLTTYGSLSCPSLEICPTSSSGNRCVSICSHTGVLGTTNGAYVSAGYIDTEGGYGTVMRGGSKSNIYCADGLGIGMYVGVLSSGSFIFDWGSDTMMSFAYASDTPRKRVQFPHSTSSIGGNTARLTSNGTLNWNSSTRRIKTDIVYDSDKFDPSVDPHQLYNLRVVQFKYKQECLEEGDFNTGRNVLGLIAEDVDEDYKIATYHDNHGTPVNWDYTILVPALIKMVQEQHEDIEILKDKLNILERSIR